MGVKRGECMCENMSTASAVISLFLPGMQAPVPMPRGHPVTGQVRPCYLAVTQA